MINENKSIGIMKDNIKNWGLFKEAVMLIRRAENRDITQINNLLKQVCLVHHKGRPDLFKKGARKYSDDQLCK